jgi:hypothetical protein
MISGFRRGVDENCTLLGYHAARSGEGAVYVFCRLCLKYDGTRAENRFRLSPKRTNPFKSAGASVQSTAGSRDVRISGSNAGYTMFRSSVKSTGYPLHSPVSPSLPLPCVTVCHQVSNALYHQQTYCSRVVLELFLNKYMRMELGCRWLKSAAK